MSDYAGRIARLQAALRAQEADFALFSASDQMRYLTGWAEPGHERLVGLFVPSRGEPVFLVPAMSAAQAKENPAGIANVIGWEDANGWLDQAEELIERFRIEHGLALIDDELHSGHLIAIQERFGDLGYVAAGETMARLREIKTPDELAAMETAARLIDSVYEETIQTLKEGLTETEVQEAILAAIKRRGTRPSFTPTVCFGPNGARPHHATGDTPLKRGDIIVIDIGCQWENYASDITRTLAFGEPGDPEAAKVYEVVYRAQSVARALARPGVSAEAVDAAARVIITDAGYGDYFIHRTGHGIGLSTHEPPYIVAGNAALLQPGMCFSVEPGIYLPGRFGVRIENIVTVTESGVRSLNAEAPAQLPVIGS